MSEDLEKKTDGMSAEQNNENGREGYRSSYSNYRPQQGRSPRPRIHTQRAYTPRPNNNESEGGFRPEGFGANLQSEAPQQRSYQPRGGYQPRQQNEGSYQPRGGYQPRQQGEGGYQPRGGYQQRGGYGQQQRGGYQQRGGGYGQQQRGGYQQRTANLPEAIFLTKPTSSKVSIAS